MQSKKLGSVVLLFDTAPYGISVRTSLFCLITPGPAVQKKILEVPFQMATDRRLFRQRLGEMVIPVLSGAGRAQYAQYAQYLYVLVVVGREIQYRLPRTLAQRPVVSAFHFHTDNGEYPPCTSSPGTPATHRVDSTVPAY